MKSNFKKEWNAYLFQEGVEYSKSEVIEKIIMMYKFFKSKKMRVDVTLWTNPKKFEQMYRLTDEEVQKYTEFFKRKLFDSESCNKIVHCMGVVYHMLDISLDEALDFADYTSQNRLTLTKGMKDKFDVDLDEISLYFENVMVKNAKFCVNQVLKYGKELCDDLEKIINE